MPGWISNTPKKVSVINVVQWMEVVVKTVTAAMMANPLLEALAMAMAVVVMDTVTEKVMAMVMAMATVEMEEDWKNTSATLHIAGCRTVHLLRCWYPCALLLRALLLAVPHVFHRVSRRVVHRVVHAVHVVRVVHVVHVVHVFPAVLVVPVFLAVRVVHPRFVLANCCFVNVNVTVTVLSICQRNCNVK